MWVALLVLGCAAEDEPVDAAEEWDTEGWEARPMECWVTATGVDGPSPCPESKPRDKPLDCSPKGRDDRSNWEGCGWSEEAPGVAP